MSREFEATAKLAPCPHCRENHDEDSLRCPNTDMLLPLEGRRLDGKFRFLSTLGTGGMAAVYLAVNERVDREVAIKFLRPEVGRDAEAVARFRSEARAAGRIGNTHICEILDLGESPIGPFIVMERLRGIDLAALIRRQVRLAPGYAVRVVRHALEGLAAAHEAGIVHRDLKPGNVFLHRTETGDTVVKLMDFGVSKFLDGSGEAETASGILLGTPEYMAPEQLEGAHLIGPPADIWAMGAILYRAITGQQVFSGPNLAVVLKAMAVDEVTPVSELVTGVPPALEAIIHRCLQRDVSARYESARALSDALAPFEVLDIEVTPIVPPEPVVEQIEELDVEFEFDDEGAAEHGDGREVEATQVWKDPPSDVAPPSPLGPTPTPKSPNPKSPTPAPAPTGQDLPVAEPTASGPPPSHSGVIKGEIEVAFVKPPPRKRTGLWVAIGLAAVAAVAVAVVFGADLLGRDATDPIAATSGTPTPTSAGDSGETQAAATAGIAAADETGGTSGAHELVALAETGETGELVAVAETGETETGDETGETETGETETGATEIAETGDDSDTDSGDSDGSAYVAGTERKPPLGTFRSGPFITPYSPGSAMDFASAKRQCEAIAAKAYAGISDWKLASPTEARKFIGTGIKRSRYWTTALHDGRALVFTLPGGKKTSEKADRKIARPLCVVKY